MQKKLIALAVAGLISAPAFAQSKVEIYGVVDMGYSWKNENVERGTSSRSGIDSGQSTGSRLGFRGTEDLGNGLKASFVLEQGINVDRGTSAQNNRTFGRQAYLALSSNTVGTVALGRQYTPQYVIGGLVDPFAHGTVGRMDNVYLREDRLDNLIAYVSPDWGGFSFIAGYTGSAAGDESISNKGGDIEVFAITPMFKSGPLLVAFNYHEARLQRSGQSDDKIKVYDLMGSYDFGVVKIGAAYGHRKVDNFDYLANAMYGQPGFADVGEDSDMWMIGATIPLGANNIHKIMASYSHRDTDRAVGSDARVSQWALGYEYALSKRTSLYAAYSDINNNSAAKNSGLHGTVGDAGNNGLGYQQGANLGIRHTF